MTAKISEVAEGCLFFCFIEKGQKFESKVFYILEQRRRKKVSIAQVTFVFLKIPPLFNCPSFKIRVFALVLL
jgi:hypothetical protein